jgi:hypothetical protein
MILLNAQYVTTVTTTVGGATQTLTTDTLFVSSVRLDFQAGIIYATVQRGTGSNPFAANMDSLEITVNPDGAFCAADGSWSGTISGGISSLISSLKSQFDQMPLASGEVTGTPE